MGRLLDELKRRNVFRAGIAYGVVGWLLVQITALSVPAVALTAEGLKRIHQVDPEASIAPSTGRKLDFVIIALVFALGYFVWESRFVA